MRNFSSNFLNKTIYLLLLIGSLQTVFSQENNSIHWLSFEQAVELQAQEGNSKKIFIDVYTDWCGWCKKMDKNTFQNPEVAAYMKEHFYMVKLDGEGKEPIVFKAQTFSFVPSGRNGYHELAANLLQGQLSYPTVVYLDENMNMLSPVPGYLTPEPFLKIATYFGDDIYKTTTWEDYSK
jgi:thioredoxin-related protein